MAGCRGNLTPWGIPLYEAELREGVQPLLQEGVVFQGLVQVVVGSGEIQVHVAAGVFLAVEFLARGQEGIVVVQVPEVAVELDAVAQRHARDAPAS